MKILGISSHFHDAAAALVVDGIVVAASQEERLSRRKGDPGLPVNAALACLGQAGLAASDLDAVVFYEKPFRKFYRIVAASLANAPFGYAAFKGALHTWFEKKLWIRSEIAKGLGIAPGLVSFSDHHLSHAASAFLTQPRPSAATLVVDGVGEWKSTSIGRMTYGDEGFKYEVLESVDFPHSLGLLYSALTAFLGFRVNEGEYKVMGLAPYGEPLLLESMRRLLRHGEGARFRLDLSYFGHDYSISRGWRKRMEELLGEPISPQRALSRGQRPEEFKRAADIAASLQCLLEGELERLMRRAKELTGEDCLAYSGGVALNCVANGKLARAGIFERLLVHSASGDAGGALGAALAFAASQGERLLREGITPFLGQLPTDSGCSLHAIQADPKWQLWRARDEAEFAEHVAAALADDQIIGWIHGRAEWGPRALGARSILARPDSAGQQERLNRMIKHRESFRPFAPVVLDSEAETYFEHFTPDRALERHMLTTVQTKTEWRERLAAVTHVDGSARVQCLRQEDGPLLHRMLSEFQRQSGLPILVNTSFNDAGEPIVNSLEDALGTLLRCGLDAVAAYPYIYRPEPCSEPKETEETLTCSKN